jgi:hypothetical protein
LPAGIYVKISARKWIISVSIDGRATWTQIKGINKFSLDRNSVRTDTSDFLNDGVESGEIMARGAAAKLDGFFLEDSTGARDPGQLNVETFSETTGAASVGDFRFISPNGKSFTFSATVDLNPWGGGNNEKTTWGAALIRTGAMVTP